MTIQILLCTADRVHVIIDGKDVGFITSALHFDHGPPQGAIGPTSKLLHDEIVREYKKFYLTLDKSIIDGNYGHNKWFFPGLDHLEHIYVVPYSDSNHFMECEVIVTGKVGIDITNVVE